MKTVVLGILVICSVVYSAEPVGFFQCKTVFVEQYKNGAVSRKRLSIKSLYLNVTRERIFIYGTESGRNICRDLRVDKIYRDTLFFTPRLQKNMHDKARLYFNRDTLSGDYNFLDNRSSDSVAVKILVSRVSQGVIDRAKRQCRD